MERLTKIINGRSHGAEGVSADKLTGKYCRGEFEATAIVEKLAHYEDLEESGRLLVLPEGEGRTLFLKVLAYSDAICPSCLGLESIPCTPGTDCVDCWEAALKGENE